VALGGWTLGPAAPAEVLGRGGAQVAAELARYGGSIGRVNVFVRRSELGDGKHGPLNCAELRKDLEEHAKFVTKIYEDIDACDEGDTPCDSTQLNKLFTALEEALKDQADAIEEYNRKCLEPAKLLG
jgi:hypothetical protein